MPNTHLLRNRFSIHKLLYASSCANWLPVKIQSKCYYSPAPKENYYLAQKFI